MVYGNCDKYKNKHIFSNEEPDLHFNMLMYKGLQYAMYFKIQSAPCKLKKISFFFYKNLLFKQKNEITILNGEVSLKE